MYCFRCGCVSLSSIKGFRAILGSGTNMRSGGRGFAGAATRLLPLGGASPGGTPIHEPLLLQETAVITLMDITMSYQDLADEVFGDNADTMDTLAERAARILPPDAILWECDASTFAFSFVSESARAVLGYPTWRWLADTTFWATRVVHEYDAEEAVKYCATETACDRDHAFEYRARTVDGRVVRLRDVVRVVPPMDGRPKRLRGVMFVVG